MESSIHSFQQDLVFNLTQISIVID
jgi:hypothetical protein